VSRSRRSRARHAGEERLCAAAVNQSLKSDTRPPPRGGCEGGGCDRVAGAKAVEKVAAGSWPLTAATPRMVLVASYVVSKVAAARTGTVYVIHAVCVSRARYHS